MPEPPAYFESGTAPTRATEPSGSEAFPVDRAGPSKPDDSPGQEVKPGLEGGLERLAVPGFGNAVVSVPRRSGAAKPLLVALHGAGGRPEPLCEHWRGIVGERGFVLCPPGTAFDAKAPEEKSVYFYRSPQALADELDAAVSALAARHGQDLDPERAALVGFSQGAIMASHMLRHEGGTYPHVILVEGGHDKWNALASEAFRAAGGERVALVCGRPRCASAARESARALAQAGLGALVAADPAAGHAYGGPLSDEERRAFAWVTEGDPRWTEEQK